MTSDQFIQIALSFPNSIAKPHFDRTAFKVINKRILQLCMRKVKPLILNFHLLINQFIVSLIKKRSIG